MSISSLLTDALQQRQDFLAKAKLANTDCYRVFHGTVEGANGVNVDRYGGAWLIQTFHQTLTTQQQCEISEQLKQQADLPVIYNDRSQKNSRVINPLSAELEQLASTPMVMHENDIKFTSKLRHEGQDPLLFLDMRVGREYVKSSQLQQNGTESVFIYLWDRHGCSRRRGNTGGQYRFFVVRTCCRTT